MRNDISVETERLRLAPLAPEHAAGLYGGYGDAEAMRYWHEPPHGSVDETRALIDRLLAGPERSWALVLKSDGTAIGHVYYLGNHGPPGMGYMLGRRHWGQGLMSEAVRAALGLGFDFDGLDRVELWIHEANTRSRRLAERNGFRRRGGFPMRGPDGALHEKEVYGLRRSEWQETSQSASARSYGLKPVLPVADVAATAAWYRDQLGFEIGFLHGDPPGYAGVSLGEWTNSGAQIHFERVDKPATNSGISLYLVVGADIDRLHDQYRAKGVEIVAPPSDRPWGARVFAIRDCNGYVLTFNTMP